jgi:hypothetical protein
MSLAGFHKQGTQLPDDLARTRKSERISMICTSFPTGGMSMGGAKTFAPPIFLAADSPELNPILGSSKSYIIPPVTIRDGDYT